MGDIESLNSRPLPLKQRTSSIDHRKDYSSSTLISLLQLLKVREFFVTVDNFCIWRRHLAWAMEEGGNLRAYMTARYASNMVFLSLLLGSELNVLFNSNEVATEMRSNMREENMSELSFWVGIQILISIFLCILSLFSTFTAWGMVNAISDENAHCVLRSSMGQYVAELPGRLVVASIYAFLTWVMLLLFILLPSGGKLPVLLAVLMFGMFVHVVIVFSSFGRLIMHTGAMGSRKIFETNFERGLLPHGLHAALLSKARAQLKANTSILRQYQRPPKPLKRMTSDNTMASEFLAERNEAMREHLPSKRRESSVRFTNDFLNSVHVRENSFKCMDRPPEKNGTVEVIMEHQTTPIQNNKRVKLLRPKLQTKERLSREGNHLTLPDEKFQGWLKGGEVSTKKSSRYWGDMNQTFMENLQQTNKLDPMHNYDLEASVIKANKHPHNTTQAMEGSSQHSIPSSSKRPPLLVSVAVRSESHSTYSTLGCDDSFDNDKQFHKAASHLPTQLKVEDTLDSEKKSHKAPRWRRQLEQEGIYYKKQSHEGSPLSSQLDGEDSCDEEKKSYSPLQCQCEQRGDNLFGYEQAEQKHLLTNDVLHGKVYASETNPENHWPKRSILRYN